MFNYARLPEHIQHGTQLYIEHGVLPGDFEQAVICNKLKESFMYADDINLHHMFDIVSFWYNEAPIGCWGSAERMKEWHELGGFEGLREKIKEQEKTHETRP